MNKTERKVAKGELDCWYEVNQGGMAGSHYYSSLLMARRWAGYYSKRFKGRSVNIFFWIKRRYGNETSWYESWRNGILFNDGICSNCGENTYSPDKELCDDCRYNEMIGMKFGIE